MLSKIATVALFTAAAAQYADTTMVVVDATAAPADLYYADYDNIVEVANKGIYYQSALTPEAVDRLKLDKAKAAEWSAPALALNPDLYNAKGVAFCGEKGAAKGDVKWGGKYTQLFVADAGEEGKNNGGVYAWEVKPDMMDPKKIVLSGKWTVYEGEAAPTDVKCGPNNGLFIADPAKNQINWVTYDNLVAKAEKPAYETVVAADCGAIVGDVRSVSWDEQKEQVLWSNNAAVPADSGVFAASAPKSGVNPIACNKDMCAAGWTQACAAKVEQVVAGEKDAKYWAVADAWNDVQVSKGADKIYGKDNKEVAAVPAMGEATYAAAAEDPKRDVLVVADQKNDDVYVVANKAAPKKIAEVDNVYGVAYNDAYGWQGMKPNSSSVVSLAVGAVLAAAALLL